MKLTLKIGLHFDNLSLILMKCHRTHERDISKIFSERLVKIPNQKHKNILIFYPTPSTKNWPQRYPNLVIFHLSKNHNQKSRVPKPMSQIRDKNLYQNITHTNP